MNAIIEMQIGQLKASLEIFFGKWSWIRLVLNFWIWPHHFISKGTNSEQHLSWSYHCCVILPANIVYNDTTYHWCV